MIASGNQCRPCRRTQRRREHPVIAQALFGNTIHRRGRNYTAEGTRYAEPSVVGDDQQYVGGILGRHNTGGPPRLGLQSSVFDHTAKFGSGGWKLLPTDGHSGTGGTWYAVDFLR